MQDFFVQSPLPGPHVGRFTDPLVGGHTPSNGLRFFQAPSGISPVFKSSFPPNHSEARSPPPPRSLLPHSHCSGPVLDFFSYHMKSIIDRAVQACFFPKVAVDSVKNKQSVPKVSSRLCFFSPPDIPPPDRRTWCGLSPLFSPFVLIPEAAPGLPCPTGIDFVTIIKRAADLWGRPPSNHAGVLFLFVSKF